MKWLISLLFVLLISWHANHVDIFNSEEFMQKVASDPDYVENLNIPEKATNTCNFFLKPGALFSYGEPATFKHLYYFRVSYPLLTYM